MSQLPQRLQQNGTVYADVANGSGSATYLQQDFNSSNMFVGQWTLDGNTYTSSLVCWTFDSTFLFETPTAMYAYVQSEDSPTVVHCAQLSFGNPVTASDWKTPAQLAALTKIGTRTVRGNGTAFGTDVLEIDTSGLTFGGDVTLIFWTDDQENAVTPTIGPTPLVDIKDIFVKCPYVTPGATGTYATEVAADSPTLWWRLGETSGTVAADSSGNGHTGTYTNSPTLNQPGLVHGDSNKAVVFSNAANSLIVSDTDFGGSDFSGSGLTIECIVNETDLSFTTVTYFVCAGFEGGLPGSDTFSTEIDLETWGKGQTDTEVMMAAYLFGPTSFFLLEQDTPTHMAVCIPADGSLNHTRVFTNGDMWQTVHPVDQTAFITGLGSNDHFYGGGDPFSGSPSDAMDGTLDEVAFYSASLSTTRIRSHAKAAGLAGPPGNSLIDAVGITDSLFVRPFGVRVHNTVGLTDILVANSTYAVHDTVGIHATLASAPSILAPLTEIAYIQHYQDPSFSIIMDVAGSFGVFPLNTFPQNDTASFNVGAEVFTGEYDTTEAFLTFNTRFNGTPTTATLKLFAWVAGGGFFLNTATTLNVAAVDWGGTPIDNSVAWQTIAALGALTPCGSVTLNGFYSAGTEIDVAIDPTVLNLSGRTRFVLYTDNQSSGTPPTGHNQMLSFDNDSFTTELAVQNVTRNDIYTVFDAVGITDTVHATAQVSRIYTVTKPDVCRDPSYHPNGLSIVMAEKIGSQNQLSQINVNGSGHTVLVTGTDPFYDPQWSPDGMFLLFAQQTAAPDGGHPQGQWAIKYRDQAGVVTTIVSDVNANMHPVWLTATQIAFQRKQYGTDTTFHIVLMDLAGTVIADAGAGEYPRLVVV